MEWYSTPTTLTQRTKFNFLSWQFKENDLEEKNYYYEWSTTIRKNYSK